MECLVMNKIALVPLLACFLFLAGCAVSITPEQIANADYGAPPPKNYQELIKKSFATVLIDPTAPLYDFSTPSKGYLNSSSVIGTQQMFGWKVCGTVNSKNRMGGYVGSVPFLALFRDGRVAQKVIGESADLRDGFSLVNMAITDACQR
jgi:hypothetical protein